MFRSLLAILLLLILATGVGAAKKKKLTGAAKAQAQTEKNKKDKEQEIEKETKEPVATAAKDEPGNPSTEMEIYRAIQKREQSTVQDLADLTLMYRGEFAKIPTAEKRLVRARELKIVKAQKAGDILERGTLAYAIMKLYQPESGVLFWLTDWERYAMRDVQEAGIMPAKATVSQHVSGEQLMGTITAAEEYTENKKKWGKEK